jgi:SAM-dependent methyltransferase
MNEQHMEFCCGPVWQQMIEEMVMPDALANVDLGDDVLEIGPGPGFTTDVLRARTRHMTVVEIDPGLAAALAKRLGGTNVDVIEGDACALDLPSDRFSAAASFHMLHHVATDEGQNQILSELARVLQPGGVLVAADGVFNEGTIPFHEGDTYHPIELDDIAGRLEAVGFRDIDVRATDLGWLCTARAS